jgi:acetylornithine deacetylase/succinyl-diaminopimelate desuccinylase-like protein
VTGLVDWPALTAEASRLLCDYVKIDSAHPAGRTVETAAFIADVLASEGIESRVYPTPDPGRVNLVARVAADNPDDKPVLLSNHMDVVQAVESDWSFPPFAGDLVDGYIRGRGALDMKGMGIMEIMCLLQARRLGLPLRRDLVLLCTCDEEIGSVLGAKLMVENHYADLDPGFVLDEGGSGMDGFFSAGKVFAVSVGEKKIVWAKLVARAEPGHGSMPFDGAATHRMVKAADAILAQGAEDRESPAVAEMLRRLGGSQARKEIESYRATKPLLRDTISLTMLEGGHTINIIPEQAEMSFDCRLLPDTDEAAFLSNIEQVVNDPAISVEIIQRGLAAPTAPWDNDYFGAIEQSCLAHYPDAVVTPSLFVAGTDSRFFRERGVPAYGLVPCIFTGEDLKGYHGIDERLSVANLELGTKIILDLVGRLAVRDV